MATIAGLTENFEGGADGAAIEGASIFTNKTGGGQATFSTTHFLEGTRGGYIAPASGSVSLLTNPAGVTNAWLSFYIKPLVAPTIATAICNFFHGTVKIGDIRFDAGGTALHLRVNNTQIAATPYTLTIGEWHRVSIQIFPNATGGALRLKVYSGANLHGTTANYDTGAQTPTTTATAFDTLRFGSISTDATLEYAMDRIRADDAVEPAAMTVAAGPVANAGPDQINIEPFNTFTVNGSASTGTGIIYSWSAVTAGAPPLTGTTATRTATAPATLTGGTFVYRLIVTDSAGVQSAADTVSITILPWDHWFKMAGAWTPARQERQRISGAWTVTP